MTTIEFRAPWSNGLVVMTCATLALVAVVIAVAIFASIGPPLFAVALLIVALATDPSRAVVLRYADRTVVISPHDPQQFIMRAGTFIKIAGFPG